MSTCRANPCITCRQGRGAECRCAEATVDITGRLEPLPQPWTWRDAARAAAAVMLLATAAFLLLACGGGSDGQDEADTRTADAAASQQPPNSKTTQPVSCAASGSACAI